MFCDVYEFFCDMIPADTDGKKTRMKIPGMVMFRKNTVVRATLNLQTRDKNVQCLALFAKMLYELRTITAFRR